jgi:hypothetical protein
LTNNTFYDIIQTERGKELNIMKNNKHYNIVRTYNICGREVECLCYDAGCAITHNEEEAKARVATLKEMGYTNAHYIVVENGTAWYEDKNWIG